MQGVSTKKVKTIIEELCGNAFSASAISAINKRLDESLRAFAERPLHESWLRLFGQRPAEFKWASCRVALSAGLCDFAAASEGRSPTRAAAKSRGDDHAAVAIACAPK